MNIPDYDGLRVEVDDAVARLTMTRADHGNTLPYKQLCDLVDACRWLDNERSIKVVVVDGDGRHFSAGAAVNDPETADLSPRVFIEAGHLAANAMSDMRAVTVAKLHGVVRGGGAVLAMACDLRFAVDDTVFSFPEARLGWPLPWGAVPRLVREIGPMRTKDLVLNCRPMSAAVLVEAGLALACAPTDEIDDLIADTVANLSATASIVLESVNSYIDACAESMVSGGLAGADVDRMQAAMGDDEARSTTRDAFARLLAREQVGARSLSPRVPAPNA